MMLGLLLQTTTNSCTSGLASCLSTIYLPWFAFAGLAAIAVIAVLAVMYGISGFIGRSDIRTWVRVKIYDVVVSLVFIMIFVSIAAMLYNFNVGGLTNVQLVPPQCQSGSSSNILGSNVDPTQNIFAMAICDMYTFNTYTAEMNTAQYYMTLTLGALQPRLQIGLSGSTTQSGVAVGISTGTTSYITLIPAETAFKYLGTGVDLIYSFVLANDVQLLLLSAAPLVFAILVSLGLIARVFGVTRTFGGAMIAFGVGLGFLYPVLVSLTYGFINYGISQVYSSAASSLATYGIINIGTSVGLPLAGAGALASGAFPASKWITLLASLGSTTFNAATAFYTFLPEPIFVFAGLVWVGLTFIPLIVLVLVDVFIIDFSQAIGERMDLLSMLIRIL